MQKKEETNNRKSKEFNAMDALYYPIDYHRDEEETAMDNPEKYGFITALEVGYSGITGMPMTERDAVDYLVVGYTGRPRRLFGFDTIQRDVIVVPGTENLLIIYNQYYEDEYKEKLKGHMQPIIKIPELDFELYTRCYVCRQNEKGELCSIENGDGQRIAQYIPEK